MQAALILLSAVYWAAILMLSYLAVFAPCGIMPGAWCEEEGPNWLGAILSFLGPIGLLVCAAAIYMIAMWRLVLRRKKQRH